MSEWKPGDVVTATVNGRPNVRLIAGWSKYEPQLRWGELSPRWADGDDEECWFFPHQVTDVRRLVVIDPEDREQVERLAEAYKATWVGGSRSTETTLDIVVRQMQAALREFANPTPLKPDEPTGLGAVVEDADGERYVRHGSADLDDSVAWCNSIGVGHSWERIAAVKVLSEGVVTP